METLNFITLNDLSILEEYRENEVFRIETQIYHWKHFLKETNIKCDIVGHGFFNGEKILILKLKKLNQVALRGKFSGKRKITILTNRFIKRFIDEF